MLLGHYENFPENVHVVADFYYQVPTKDIQQAILCAFHQLNHEICDLGTIMPFVTKKCEMGFEFGVAEGFDFNFLDQKELNEYLKFISKNELQKLDFFVVVRYHIIKEDGKRVPLRFDYYVIRCVFKESRLQMRIRHEKGSQRVTPNDFTDFLTEIINDELSRKQLNPLLSGVYEKIGIS